MVMVESPLAFDADYSWITGQPEANFPIADNPSNDRMDR